jgi:hypothetical protein
MGIIMKLKEKSNPMARLKYLCILPLACVTVLAFARPQVSTIERQSTDSTMRIRSSLLTKKNYKPLLVVNGVSYDYFDPNFDFFNSNEEQWAKLLNVNSEEILEITRLCDPESKAIWGNRGVNDVIEITLNKFPTISITHKPNKKPEYPGGMEALMKYLQESLFYPALAQKYDIERRFVCKFIVTAEGDVVYVKVVRGVSPEFDRRAMYHILNMPDWTPGTKKGKNVNVYYKLSFKIKKLMH